MLDCAPLSCRLTDVKRYVGPSLAQHETNHRKFYRKIPFQHAQSYTVGRSFFGGRIDQGLDCSSGFQKRDCTVKASVVATNGVKWWEKNSPPNMNDIHSTQDFVEALAKGGDKLVVMEFYATWCGSCKALYPKLCKIAEEHSDVLFYKVNFDENKSMCKSLSVKVLPFFHFYRGADGRVDAFSASVSKVARLREALAKHNTERCFLGPPLGVGDLQLPFDTPENSELPSTAVE